MINFPKNHALIIYDQPEPRQVFLTATTYSMGRDVNNAIVVPHQKISRQHALLLRMPLLQKGHYGYRILDGNAAGQPSLNGLIINGVKRATWDLNPGDLVVLGGAVVLKYQTPEILAESKYSNYIKFQTPETRGMKVKIANHQATITSDVVDDDYPSLEEQLLRLQKREEDSLFTGLFKSLD